MSYKIKQVDFSLTDKDKKILEFLKIQKEPISPTNIGLHFGKCYTQASSWSNNSLKKLVDLKLISRFNGKYSVV
jgi:hypothetical protein